MNLGQLRFAKAAAEERSFSKAAEKCNVTQPTLSNGIALLEEEFGGQLFARTTRRVDLTPFGMQLLPLIEALLQAQAELEAGVRTFHNPAHKIVRIGLSPLIDARLLTQVLEPYKAAHSGVEIFYKECFLGDLEERLDKEQTDIMLRALLPDEKPSRALSRSLFYEEDLFYMPKQASAQAIAEGGSVLLKSVARETFVLSSDGCGLAIATRRLFEDAGFKIREYTGHTLSYQVMQEWADIGIGATILPRSKITSEYRDKAQRLMIDAKNPARLRYEAFWKKSAAYPDHVAAFHRHFRDTVPKLVAGQSVQSPRH
jgi:LysR family transcriptional regulator, hydrogen peroxide-inducible genes activator